MTATVAEPQPGDELTKTEVAVRCRVSERTVDRWLTAGKLTPVKLPGGQVRISRAELDRLLSPTDR